MEKGNTRVKIVSAFSIWMTFMMRMPFIRKKATLGKRDGFGGNDVFFVYIKTQNHRIKSMYGKTDTIL